MTNNLRALANRKLSTRHNSIICCMWCIHQEHGNRKWRRDRNGVRTAPKGYCKILVYDVLLAVTHLNLGLSNLARLKNNVRPVAALITNSQNRRRSAALFRCKDDHFCINELSWLPFHARSLKRKVKFDM